MEGYLPAIDNKTILAKAFQLWEMGDSGPFFDVIADDVVWTVIGSTKVSGVYRSKQDLIDHAFGPLLNKLDGDLKTTRVDIVVEHEKAILQFESSGVAANGTKYDQVYCWAMKMRDGRIVEIIAYLDTDLLRRVFELQQGLKCLKKIKTAKVLRGGELLQEHPTNQYRTRCEFSGGFGVLSRRIGTNNLQ
jgi:ketosteroid isomerase-like protein